MYIYEIIKLEDCKGKFGKCCRLPRPEGLAMTGILNRIYDWRFEMRGTRAGPDLSTSLRFARDDRRGCYASIEMTAGTG